jgi:Ca2+-binding RTX toxin-like protein
MIHKDFSADDERRVSDLVFGRAGLFPERPDIAFTAPLTSLAVIEGASGEDFLSGTEENDIITGDKGNDILVGGKGHDQLYGNRGSDILKGQQGDDILIGGAGKDTLRGGRGKDAIDGGPGLDKMIGGAGDDIYVVDNKGDEVIESEHGGHDLIGTHISLTMPLWVEEIIALEDAPIDLVGNELDNLMVGNARANVIRGGKGADSLVGNGGKDALIGNAGDDILVGSSGNDTLRGGPGSDTLDGGDGHDTLYGNNGPDILFGGMGNNTLVGGKGSDAFGIEFPGSQFDLIRDFEVGEAGDRILIADEVFDIDLTQSVLDEYVQILGNSGSTTIGVDSDGGGDSFIIVARLENVAGMPASSLVVADDGTLIISSTG